MTDDGFRLQTSELDKLAHQMLHIENELNSNIPVTLWISDLHGEGDRFKMILRGRFGMIYQTCREALPSTFSIDKIQYLTQIIRKKKYFVEDHVIMDTQDVIFCLVDILKYRLSNIRNRTKNIFKVEFENTIQRLISGLPVPDQVFEEDVDRKSVV